MAKGKNGFQGSVPNGTNNFLRLRQVAEEILERKTNDKRKMSSLVSPEDPARLFHEMQVQQIELETQNEELVRTQIELEACKGKYIDLYEFAPLGYLTVTEAGLITEANLTGAKLLGVTKNLLIRKPLAAFVALEDQDLYYHLCKSGELDQTMQSREIKLKRGNNTFFWARLEIRSILCPNGSRTYELAFMDITDQKKADEARKQSETLLSSLVENQLEMICRYLPDGKITFVNDAYLRSFEKTRREILGSNFIPHIPEPDLSAIKDRLRHIAPATPKIDVQHRVIFPNGTIRWQYWIHRGFFGLDGLPVEFQASGRDITEEKTAESLARELHDLLSLIGANQEKAKQVSVEAAHPYLEKIRESVERANQIVKQLGHPRNPDKSDLLRST